MAAAALVYFLFTIVAGQGSGASLTTLASFHDMAGCKSAAAAVTTAMQRGTQLASAFCVSSADLEAFSNAAGGK